MFFTERLRILQTVEKLEINPFSLLQEILRSTVSVRDAYDQPSYLANQRTVFSSRSKF